MAYLVRFIINIFMFALQRRPAKASISISVICLGFVVSISSNGEFVSANGAKLAQAAASIYLPIIIEKQAGPVSSGDRVVAKVETDPVPSDGDAADDPAIWVHPTNSSLSLILGTDKKSGLAVYDLSGKQLQFLPDGRLNNVDLRYRFPLGGQEVDLVTAGNRSDDSIAVYRVNAQTRRLENVSAPDFKVEIDVYGSCMYHSPTDGKFYVFVNSKSGEVEQWELVENDAGKVEGQLVRSFDAGTQTEGCVADDETGDFYIGEEAKGIWKYGAEPGDGESRSMVDSTGEDGHLEADVEGLTIYYASNGNGYLIASSQGNDKFVVYERQGSNKYVMTFQIESSNGIDAVTNTDGIDVIHLPLGSIFHQGVFVAQDGNNDDGNQNYKLVPWQDIANSVSPPLIIDANTHTILSQYNN